MIVIYHPENCQPQSRSAVTFGSVKDKNYITLRKGRNDLETAEIEFLKAHSDFETYTKWGAIELIEPEDVALAEERPDSLLAYDTKKQARLIAYCTDIPTLEKWRDATQSPKIKSSIQLRIAAVNEGR